MFVLTVVVLTYRFVVVILLKAHLSQLQQLLLVKHNLSTVHQQQQTADGQSQRLAAVRITKCWKAVGWLLFSVVLIINYIARDTDWVEYQELHPNTGSAFIGFLRSILSVADFADESQTLKPLIYCFFLQVGAITELFLLLSYILFDLQHHTWYLLHSPLWAILCA